MALYAFKKNLKDSRYVSSLEKVASLQVAILMDPRFKKCAFRYRKNDFDAGVSY